MVEHIMETLEIIEMKIVTQVKCSIEYFFHHYKDLEPNKWSKIIGWANREKADEIILESIERYGANKH